MIINRTLEKWETFTNKLVEHFILKYFEVEDASDVEMNWIGYDVGSVCMINDYFFNMSDIKFCLKNNVEINKLFEWYDYVLENPDEYINLNSFNMGAKEVLKQREESLKKSKKAVKKSEKLFFKMLQDEE